MGGLHIHSPRRVHDGCHPPVGAVRSLRWVDRGWTATALVCGTEQLWTALTRCASERHPNGL